MSVDYIVASLPALAFGAPAPITWEKFCELCGGFIETALPAWNDLETQLKNAIAEARGGANYKRHAEGCSLYWKNRILECFQENDVAKRDEMLDRVRWDAAGELIPPSEPLGKGALAAYAIRLQIALRRDKISKDRGNAAFDRLTTITRAAETSASTNL